MYWAGRVINKEMVKNYHVLFSCDFSVLFILYFSFISSPVPSSVATDVSVAPTDPKSKEEAEEAAKKQVSIDASQPSTTIQVRLSDGSTIVARLNHSHTVADLRRYITMYVFLVFLLPFQA